MKKKPPQHENHERWLVSYADFITLLFAFFVVMFASSQTDKAKAKQMSEAVQEAFENGKTVGAQPLVARILGGTVDDTGQGNAMMKGPGGAKKSPKEAPPDEILELLPSMKRLTKELQAEIAEGKLEMHMEARGLVISLREATLFAPGSDVVTPSSFPMITKLVGVVKNLPNSLSLEGHTDSTPIHTTRFNSNWELSAARSIALLKVLSERYDIKETRMSITGYGEMMPAQPNETPEGRARNRRVDIVIKNTMAFKEPSHAAQAKNSSHSASK